MPDRPSQINQSILTVLSTHACPCALADTAHLAAAEAGLGGVLRRRACCACACDLPV